MPDQLYKLVLLHLLGRSMRTYRAILTLCRAGHPVEGLMLCRSLFEDVVAAHWAVLPENRPDLIDKVLRQGRFDDQQTAILDAEFYGRAYERQMSEKEFAAPKKEFRGGRYSWFGDVGDAKKLAIESFAARGYSSREFEFYDRIVSRFASVNLHTTSRASSAQQGVP